VSKWDNMVVNITQTWGEGGRLLFDQAPIQPPRFTLNGIYRPMTDGTLALSYYQVGFDAQYMVDYWAGIALFPLGLEPVPPLSGLPPWNGSAAVAELYSHELLQIRKELIKAACNFTRLEGLMSVTYQGVPRVDRVRMYYFDGAIDLGNKITSDLVVVYLDFADTSGDFSPLENGGGSGPPNFPK
jgi:hypothetical protein